MTTCSVMGQKGTIEDIWGMVCILDEVASGKEELVYDPIAWKACIEKFNVLSQSWCTFELAITNFCFNFLSQSAQTNGFLPVYTV